jgi:FkbM family methyltransferase
VKPATDNAPRRHWRQHPIYKAFRVVGYTWRHPANRGQRLISTLKAIRFQSMGRLFGRPALASVGERSTIRADADVYHSARALYANPVDWNEMLAWRHALSPGDLFVDVGANVGVYTIWAIEAGADVIAMEPSRAARQRLLANLELNGYNADVRAAAAGEETGTLPLTTALDNENHVVLGDEDAAETEEVPVITLDELVGDREVAGLKVDVEGAEMLVLRGARRLLAERRIGLIQVEWNSKSQNLLGETRTPIAELLESHGYALYRPDESGTLQPLTDRGFGDDVFAKPTP